MNIPKQFHDFYQQYWKDRWQTLLPALLQPAPKIVRLNPFIDQATKDKWKGSLTPFVSPWGLKNAFLWGEHLKQIPRDEHSGLLLFYVSDSVSYLISQVLPVDKGQQFLDMCASPGGKTLGLIERLSVDQFLLSNEPNYSRRQRLVRNLRQYLPPQLREKIQVCGQSGGLFAKTHPQFFSGILIDAPCSGERHLLRSRFHLSRWTPRYSQNLQFKQYELLSGAWASLKPGGYLLYSVCSVSPGEGDGVVQKLVAKKGQLERCQLNLAFSEPTEWGYYFLPDRAPGGPFYVSLLRKTER
ncbi:MAG: hypothetical protein NZ480_08310 [Bdellovibrionaceae bacterium]|nr:hypothetical protein [Pseudobdellovibrionaceae bacterium]MDW8191277.1 hypothetical protein [Pseudobdellovibrionaceae bacterium]